MLLASRFTIGTLRPCPGDAISGVSAVLGVHGCGSNTFQEIGRRRTSREALVIAEGREYTHIMILRSPERQERPLEFERSHKALCRMTSTRITDDAAEIAQIRELIRSVNLRSTTARITVMRAMRRASSPRTHAEVANELAAVGFDRATVFRNLNDLTEAGLLARTELGDHVWRFELRDPNQAAKSNHHHFLCVDCGSVTCLSEVELNPKTKRRANKIGRVTEVLLKGHCTRCCG